MSSKELSDLAREVEGSASEFLRYREKLVLDFEAKRERNVMLSVAATAGSMIGVITIQPGVTLACVGATLVAVGFNAYHKISGMRRLGRLSDGAIVVLRDVASEQDASRY